MNFLINFKDKKNNFLKKENFYYLIIILLIFFFDRFSKSKIISNFNENIYYINDYVNFNLIWNIGIGFGLLSSDSSLFYNILTILIGLVFVGSHFIAINTVEDPAGFYPPYIEKKIVYPEVYKK